MTSPHDHDEDDLSPDELQLVEAFSEQLAGGLDFDDLSHEVALTDDGITVPVSQAQADEYAKAVYDTALAKVLAKRPSPPSKWGQIAAWIVGFSATAVIVALAAAAIRALLS